MIIEKSRPIGDGRIINLRANLDVMHVDIWITDEDNKTIFLEMEEINTYGYLVTEMMVELDPRLAEVCEEGSSFFDNADAVGGIEITDETPSPVVKKQTLH